MAYIVVLLIGFAGGGICALVALDTKRRRLDEQKRQQEIQAEGIQEATQAAARLKQDALEGIKTTEQSLRQQAERLEAERAGFEARFVSYRELQDENTILKRDLQNVDVNLRKLELDCELRQERQEALDRRSKELANRYLKETIKWTSSSLSTNNFVACKQRLQNVIAWCREIGFQLPPEEEAKLLADLKQEFEGMVRAAFAREEQARIKARIREDQQFEREVQREREQLERERAAIQAALDKALAEAKDDQSAEIQRLRTKLAEAEAKSQRAKSQAQMTKSGYVYVISNIGSFGEGVFKIGMTRRLEPEDRVRELGDASVPFPFDVHMMVSCDDAPALENALHRELHKRRMNKLKPRKEFFKTDIETVRRIVEEHRIAEEHHVEVQYVADPEALEYRQSLTASDEDAEFIESVYDGLEEDNETPPDDH